jgi:hypothetical protein
MTMGQPLSDSARAETSPSRGHRRSWY